MNHKEIMEKISELEQQIAELKEAAEIGGGGCQSFI